MPELPEVETTRLGLLPHALNHKICDVVVRNPKLRWPIPDNLAALVGGQTIVALVRRGKYLLLQLDQGTIIIHLGMSGSLRILDSNTPAGIHDHVDIVLDHQQIIRLRDPRRFGAVLWAEQDGLQHPLLVSLGIEPLSDDFNGTCLYQLSRRRSIAIKAFLMDSHHIVGIGNIYANEALFLAGIHPSLAAGKLNRLRSENLTLAIRDTLLKAISAGGSSLRDFVGSDGAPGYFQQQYSVYGRAELACRQCSHPIRQLRQNLRATFFCPNCQKR